MKNLCIALALSLFALPSLAHEYWIDLHDYQPEHDAPIVADLRNGQNFTGTAFPWFDRRIPRFDWIQSGTVTPVTGRAGDLPAVNLAGADDGLVVFAHRTALQVITYREWEKFAGFVTHKALGALEAHAARGLPRTGFREGYTRFAKALIGVGHGRGADAPTGLETEFVALANPYTDDMSDGLPVRLLYRGAPRAGAQIEIFDRAPDGDVSVSTVTTGPDGTARIPVRAGHRYLLDSVVLREPAPALAEARGIAWESLWAAMTFAVPAR